MFALYQFTFSVIKFFYEKKKENTCFDSFKYRVKFVGYAFCKNIFYTL